VAFKDDFSSDSGSSEGVQSSGGSGATSGSSQQATRELDSSPHVRKMLSSDVEGTMTAIRRLLLKRWLARWDARTGSAAGLAATTPS
ncbi:hypothetical protein HK405_014149, partial [Cladochytrium tenue]